MCDKMKRINVSGAFFLIYGGDLWPGGGVLGRRSNGIFVVLFFFVVFDTPYEVKKMLKYCDSSKHNFISLLSLFLSLLPSRTLNERRTWVVTR